MSIRSGLRNQGAVRNLLHSSYGSGLLMSSWAPVFEIIAKKREGSQLLLLARTDFYPPQGASRTRQRSCNSV